jgi:multidrug efflux pump subunit AcrB
MCARTIDRRDLGGVASQVEKIIAETKIPNTTQITLRGQAAIMHSSFYRLGLGLLAAIVLVYLFDGGHFSVLGGSVHHPEWGMLPMALGIGEGAE